MLSSLISRRPAAGPSRRRNPLRTGAALALSGAALLAAPGAASADSIAYVKDGNVWLSTSDGSRQYQVTTEGGYSTVSQSDHGRLVALRGDRIETFEPDGRAINVDGSTRYSILTPHSYTMPGTTFRGPFDPVISPDGMKIAYSWYYTQYGETPNCNPSTGCQTVYGRQGTNYISPDGRSPFDKPGWTEQTGWVGPSWNQDGETLLSDPIQVGNPDVVISTPGDESNGIRGAVLTWFRDPSAPGGLRDGEMSRDKTKLVFVTGEQAETLYLYRANGGYPQVPENCYKLRDGVGRISSPSWSPDGTKLAYADNNGINVLPLPDFSVDCGTPTDEHTKRVLIPGAINPDWGPADVPPARPVERDPRTTPQPRPQGPRIALRTRVALGKALKQGFAVQLSGLRAGKVKVVAKVKGKTVASGSASVARSGKATAKLRFTKAARKSLARQKTVKLALSAGKARGTLTLKR